MQRNQRFNYNLKRDQNYDQKSAPRRNNIKLSLTKINELLQKNAEQILLHLFDTKFNFDAYLNAPTLGEKLITQMIVVIEKALGCNSLKIKLIQLLNKVSDSRFFKDHVYEQISRRENNAYNIQLIRSVLNISCQMLELAPHTTRVIAPIKERLELLIRNRLNDPDLLKEFEEKFVRLERIASARLEEENKAKTFRNIDHSNLEAPNEITELNIIPSLSDILVDQVPFLRANITNGAYRDVNHYLDVQFRLLREDYLNPLREGVAKFRSILREANLRLYQKEDLTTEIKRKLRNIESLNVYFGVKLESRLVTDDGVLYAMNLNLEKSPNWDNSKKLMFGSLVCLSSDFFKTNCLVGVIGQRDLKNLKAGIIFVKFDFDLIQRNVDNLPLIEATYTLIETTAYFESYKHVLDALVSFKNSNHDEFPFKEHLVFCLNEEIDKPEYLKNAIVDFRTLVDHDKAIQIDDDSGETCYTFSEQSNYAQRILLSNTNLWPTSDQMKLDDSQYNAIRLVLENKLALIQGFGLINKIFLNFKHRFN